MAAKGAKKREKSSRGGAEPRREGGRKPLSNGWKNSREVREGRDENQDTDNREGKMSREEERKGATNDTSCPEKHFFQFWGRKFDAQKCPENAGGPPARKGGKREGGPRKVREARKEGGRKIKGSGRKNRVPMVGKVRKSGFQCLENRQNLVPMVGKSREGQREGHTDVGRKARGKFSEKCAWGAEKMQKDVHKVLEKRRKMCMMGGA
ncbi:MAG: hypothetical protein IK066_03600 [Kiritimatiellae bacterium]|nr:hypothetical protein [Kiritimatiellia bacterium]